MTPSKLILVVVGIVGVLGGLMPAAWGGGSPGEGLASCEVDNPGSGGVAIRGTAAMEVTGIDLCGHLVDFTLRLQRSGAQHFFRLHLCTSLTSLSERDIACRILNPEDTADPVVQEAVSEFVADILAMFGLDPNRRLTITSTSISGTDVSPAALEDPFDSDLLVPGTGHISALADITIYAVKP